MAKIRLLIIFIIVGLQSGANASARPCNALLAEKDRLAMSILSLHQDNVPFEIIETLMGSLNRYPERWQRIGADLVEATRLTHQVENMAVRTSLEYIPLRLIQTTHDITDTYDLSRLQSRIETLKPFAPLIADIGSLSVADSIRFLPSESPIIRAAKDPEGNYYVFDGNGRMRTLRALFTELAPELRIEIKVYEITDLNTLDFIRASQARRGGSAFADHQ